MKLLALVGRNELVEFYNSILSYKAAHNPKLPTLPEFLSLASKETPKAFDEKTDKAFEDVALKRLEQMKAKHGG